MAQDPESGLEYRAVRPAAGRGLLLILHGIGGSENQLERLTTGLDPGIRCLLLRAPVDRGPNGFAWFQATFSPESTIIDAAQAEASRLQLARLLESVQRESGIGPERTLIAGFSQGGIMSAGVALTRPDLVAGFGLLSGRILSEIAPRLGPPAALARLAGLVTHGEADGVLPVSLAGQSETWLTELGVPFESHRYPAGHEITPAMVAAFQAWAQGLLIT